jgi:Na+-driven multidrug efflux pump
MRAVLGFFSMLALGLMIAAVLVVGATGIAKSPFNIKEAGPYLDYVSVVIGLGIGLVIAVLSQVSWSELPHRFAQSAFAHARRLRLFAWAALFVAVIVYF